MHSECAGSFLTMNARQNNIQTAMFAWLICSLIFTLALIYEYKNSIVIGDERQKQEVLNKVETADNGVVHRIAHSYVSDLYGYQTQP